MKGRGGDKVRDLQQNYQVRINYDGDKVQLEGSPAEVDAVRRILEADAKELINTLAIQELKVDEKFMKHIIGKNGGNGETLWWEALRTRLHFEWHISCLT